jgi:nitrate reductase cytochrome c-type subunit
MSDHVDATTRQVDTESQRCFSCHYWRRYQCRKNAPTIDENKFALWPSSSQDNWCGEWKRNEKAGEI